MSLSSPVNEANSQTSNGNQVEPAPTADITSADAVALGVGGDAERAGSLALQSQAAKSTAIQPHIGSLPNGRPVFPQRFEYYESDTLPGHRPIALSTFKVAALLPGDRPIAASEFQVVAMLSNDRPIAARHFDYVEDSDLPGHRPIAKSTLVYDETNLLPGGRPVASNQPDTSGGLMGYLD